jgi:hypothetical protein
VRVNLGKLAYRPVVMVFGAAAGALAGSAFDRIWRTVSGTGSVPHAVDEDRGLAEILAAAALQGAVFATVKAVVERAGASGARWFTGRWPA